MWRRLQVKQSLEINAISKYGSDDVRRPLSVHQISPADTEFVEMRNGSDSKRSDRENLRNDLPPLVIHKQISGESIEDTAGVVCVEEDEKTRIASDYAEKSPLQDYLKLVTVSPSEDEVKSPKMPMLPRELFFIDLIREAERVESARSSKRIHFFPSEATENDNSETVRSTKNGKDTENVMLSTKGVEDEKKDANKLISKYESSYFVADVESPTSEKTEVFLQIDSNEGEETESIAEKPTLILQSSETNLQETSTSPS